MATDPNSTTGALLRQSLFSAAAGASALAAAGTPCVFRAVRLRPGPVSG